MANGIIPVSWGKKLRPSTVNTLDKINEVIQFINQSDIHEFTFSDSGSGESVQTANSTQLLDLTVYGKSVQDGTPTPDNPVPIQVVRGRNLLQNTATSQTVNGVTFTVNDDGSVKVSGTATAYATFRLIPTTTPLVAPAGIYTLSRGDNAIGVGIVLSEAGYVNGISISSTVSYGSVTRTFEADRVFEHIYLDVPQGETVDAVVYPQFELGTQATPYVPYGSIGLQIGETVTPIDLQGHVLASLPDGTRDVLTVDSAGVVSITQNVGVVDLGTLNWSYVSSYTRFAAIIQTAKMPISSYAIANIMAALYAPVTWVELSNSSDNMICAGYNASSTNYIAMRNTSYTDAAAFKTAMSGLLLYYELVTPQTIELGTITPPAIPDGSIITIDATLTPTIDVSWFTEDTLPEMMNSIIGLIKSLHPDDFAASTLDANVVHSINPIDIRPISDVQPISDIKPMEELETEKESEDF